MNKAKRDEIIQDLLRVIDRYETYVMEYDDETHVRLQIILQRLKEDDE